MKALKYFSYFILFSFIVFVLIGQIFGKLEYTSKVVINQSIENTWEVFTDQKKMVNWINNFKSIELITGEMNTIGAKYKLIVEDGGEEYEIIETVKELVPNKLYSLKLENDVLTNNVTFNFISIGNKTEITSSEQLEGKGFIMKPIFVFMKGYLQSESQASLDRFKLLVES